ncbi:PepSY domain-containing protein [Bacillus sp. B190/17]|uniref:PepSY domain-containing protein n=1 Tax=Bacillus lumedeiriae TaxID=3058829 RepID=A0ABW8I9N7_9BACI
MKKLVAGVLFILLVGTVGWYSVTKTVNRSESLLSEETVSHMIQKKYGAAVEEIDSDQENDQPIYKLTIIKDQIPYKVTVDGQTGEVLSFTKQKMNNKKPLVTQNTNEKESTDSTPSAPSTPITEEQAKNIALEKVTGTIIEVDLDDEDGQLVYEVDIDQSKTKEATVVINAYTGEIEAITFETKDTD